MINVEQLSTHELADCVNEYVKRAMSVVRSHEDINKESVIISITASQYGDGEYTIQHKVSIGDSYSGRPNPIVLGDNCILGAQSAVSRYLADSFSPPPVVRKLIEAPIQDNAWGNEEIVSEAKGEAEDAEISDVQDEENSDDAA